MEAGAGQCQSLQAVGGGTVASPPRVCTISAMVTSIPMCFPGWTVIPLFIDDRKGCFQGRVNFHRDKEDKESWQAMPEQTLFPSSASANSETQQEVMPGPECSCEHAHHEDRERQGSSATSPPCGQ